jgi:hypothetical protein
MSPLACLCCVFPAVKARTTSKFRSEVGAWATIMSLFSVAVLQHSGVLAIATAVTSTIVCFGVWRLFLRLPTPKKGDSTKMN